MKRAFRRAGRPGRRGFTLLELLIAITLLAVAFSIAYGTFAAATRAWRRGTEVADAIGEGDLVMERLVAALRSAVYFPGEDPRYGFRHEATGADPPADRVSWVTAASGFLPPDAPLAHAPYRIEIALDPLAADDGPALVQRAWRHLVDDPREDQVDTRIIARSVRGFRVRMHDEEEGAWSDEWPRTNAIPHRVEFTLLLPGGETQGEDIVVQRHVEVPIAPLSTQAPAPAQRARR